MFKKALSCIMVLAMLATMVSIPTFAADTVVNPNLLFSADFDGNNPTPTAIDTEIVSVGEPTMANDGNAVKLAYDGSKKGVVVGIIYGLLQAVQDPFIIHPAQFLLDYPLAFAMVGFVGALKDFNLFNNLPQVKFLIGGIICGVLRYLSHVLSGVFAFGAYATDSGASSFLTYSAVYNTYVFIDIALVIIVGLILFSSKSFIKEINKLSQDK